METLVAAINEDEPVVENRPYGPLNLIIEFKKGTMRPIGESTGFDMYMCADYGYVEGTVSMEEGDGLDVFVNPDIPSSSGKVYFIALMEDGIMEEEKVFLNFTTSRAAQDCFQQHYGAEKFGYIYVMKDEDFFAMCQSQVRAAELKNRAYAATNNDGAEEDASSMDAITVSADTEMKSAKRTSLFALAKGMNSEQLAGLIQARREMRNE